MGKFIYVKGQKIECIDGHTDHIIPIVYGSPTKKLIEKSTKGFSSFRWLYLWQIATRITIAQFIKRNWKKNFQVFF